MEEQTTPKPIRWPIFVVVVLLALAALPIYAIVRPQPPRFELLENATLVIDKKELVPPNGMALVRIYKVAGTFEEVEAKALQEMRDQGGWTLENSYTEPAMKDLANPGQKWETHLAAGEGIEIINCYPQSWTANERGITWTPSSAVVSPGNTYFVHVQKDLSGGGLLGRLKTALKRLLGQP